MGRLTHVDDQVRLTGYRDLLEVTPEELARLPERRRRLVRMLTATLFSFVTGALPGGASLEEAWAVLRRHPRVAAELRELLAVLADRVDHLHPSLAEDVPLQVPARYSRIEILAGFGAGNPGAALTPPWREGVKWIDPELFHGRVSRRRRRTARPGGGMSATGRRGRR